MQDNNPNRAYDVAIIILCVIIILLAASLVLVTQIR